MPMRMRKGMPVTPGTDIRNAPIPGGSRDVPPHQNAELADRPATTRHVTTEPADESDAAPSAAIRRGKAIAAWRSKERLMGFEPTTITLAT